MSMQQHPRKVLITGSSGEIGLAAAQRFAEMGCRVVLHGSHYESLQKVQEHELHENIVHGVFGDLQQALECHRVVGEAAEFLGGLDVLVNNAGVYINAPLADVSEKQWDAQLAGNAKSAFFCTQAALPWLQKSQGCVVNVASSSTQYAGLGETVFGAAKAAVVYLTQSLAAELAPTIRVNCVSPDIVDTHSAQKYADNASDPEAYRARRDAKIPLQRIARVSEIVDGMVYLASEKASYVTGTNLLIDGGRAAVGRTV